MPKLVPSPYLPVEYYVNTNHYQIAEDTARAKLEKDDPDHAHYDQVVLADIIPLKAREITVY